MAICKIADLASATAPGARLLGLDLGTKTIGLAISDAGLRLASPVGTIRRTRLQADLDALFQTVDDRGAGGLVLGLPVNMDGSEGPRAQATRQFARDLLGRRDLPLAFWDERLSTQAVERAMIEADLSRRKRKAKVDTAAAAYILQGALDAIEAIGRTPDS